MWGSHGSISSIGKRLGLLYTDAVEEKNNLILFSAQYFTTFNPAFAKNWWPSKGYLAHLLILDAAK